MSLIDEVNRRETPKQIKHETKTTKLLRIQLRSFWYTNEVSITFLPKVFFLKPFLKGKILRSSERGVNSILTTIFCNFDQLPEKIAFFA